MMGYCIVKLDSSSILLTGGTDGHTYFSSVFLYTKQYGSWTHWHYRQVRHMQTPRAWHACTLLHNTRVLVAGGSNGFEDLSSAESFCQDHESWSHEPPPTVTNLFSKDDNFQRSNIPYRRKSNSAKGLQMVLLFLHLLSRPIKSSPKLL